MSGRVLLEQVELDLARKKWADLAARLALKGFSATRSDPLDGPTTYHLSRWGRLRFFADLEAVERFAAHVGA